ncbi:hypothetical protein FUAX_05710 [Fulvitalea axinellae]|uniref:Uncharacterized protein n=1 Tax=Fulvitalea axinellae TaxID=1182444 RepID=A0AAU9CP61_9BACT|nr:hypothetical protein FUAX_05710 [Fulvitalea axinellae]
MGYSHESGSILSPEKYPEVASNIGECQAVANEIMLQRDKSQVVLIRANIREGEAEARDISEASETARLETVINILQNQIPQTPNALVREGLEAELLEAQAQLANLKVKAKRRAASPIVKHMRGNIRQNTSEVEVTMWVADFVSYLNDYVVPGNIGEGSVWFDGNEYVAQAVTN